MWKEAWVSVSELAQPSTHSHHENLTIDLCGMEIGGDGSPVTKRQRRDTSSSESSVDRMVTTQNAQNKRGVSSTPHGVYTDPPCFAATAQHPHSSSNAASTTTTNHCLALDSPDFDQTVAAGEVTLWLEEIAATPPTPTSSSIPPVTSPSSLPPPQPVIAQYNQPVDHLFTTTEDVGEETLGGFYDVRTETFDTVREYHGVSGGEDESDDDSVGAHTRTPSITAATSTKRKRAAALPKTATNKLDACIRALMNTSASECKQAQCVIKLNRLIHANHNGLIGEYLVRANIPHFLVSQLPVQGQHWLLLEILILLYNFAAEEVPRKACVTLDVMPQLCVAFHSCGAKPSLRLWSMRVIEHFLACSAVVSPHHARDVLLTLRNVLSLASTEDKPLRLYACMAVRVIAKDPTRGDLHTAVHQHHCGPLVADMLLHPQKTVFACAISTLKNICLANHKTAAGDVAAMVLHSPQLLVSLQHHLAKGPAAQTFMSAQCLAAICCCDNDDVLELVIQEGVLPALCSVYNRIPSRKYFLCASEALFGVLRNANESTVCDVLTTDTASLLTLSLSSYTRDSQLAQHLRVLQKVLSKCGRQTLAKLDVFLKRSGSWEAVVAMRQHSNEEVRSAAGDVDLKRVKEACNQK